MMIVGLTGGIGMGKSTAAATFRRAHIPVFDADAEVHALQARGGKAVPAIAAAFPNAVSNGHIDRARLRAEVLSDRSALRRLEAIMHPLVLRAEARFLTRARRRGCRIAVLDIPLLMETGGLERVDVVVVVSAPRAVQVARLRQRKKMTDAEINAVLGRQMPDAEKCRRADFVVPSGLSRNFGQLRLRRLIGQWRAAK
jgi:dephospho-CoA kinase